MAYYRNSYRSRVRAFYDTLPRYIVVKYSGAVCAETGVSIPVGESALYYPKDKRFFADASQTAYQWRMDKMDNDLSALYR